MPTHFFNQFVLFFVVQFLLDIDISGLLSKQSQLELNSRRILNRQVGMLHLLYLYQIVCIYVYVHFCDISINRYDLSKFHPILHMGEIQIKIQKSILSVKI